MAPKRLGLLIDPKGHLGHLQSKQEEVLHFPNNSNEEHPIQMIERTHRRRRVSKGSKLTYKNSVSVDGSASFRNSGFLSFA